MTWTPLSRADRNRLIRGEQPRATRNRSLWWSDRFDRWLATLLARHYVPARSPMGPGAIVRRKWRRIDRLRAGRYVVTRRQGEYITVINVRGVQTVGGACWEVSR